MAISGSRVYSALDNAVQNRLGVLNAPGITIGLTNRYATLHVGLYGYADLTTRQPVESHHLFQIGSISKGFTSLALLQLQERGLVDLHAPLERYLPWFRINSDFAPITLEHLLSHTAGIINGSDATISGITEVWNLRHTETGAPPGEFFHYSNTGYKALGVALEALLGIPIHQALQEMVLAPLGMRASCAAIEPGRRGRLAVGYQPHPDDCPAAAGAQMVEAPWLETNTADGSICAHAEDMCRYLRLLLNRGQGLISPDSFTQMITPRIVMEEDRPGESYGLGLEIRSPGNTLIGHSGGMVGYAADFLADLDAGLGAVVLTNGICEPSEIARYALDFLRAVANDETPPEPAFTDPYAIPGAEEFEGEYQLASESIRRPTIDRFELLARPPGLFLAFSNQEVPLEKQAEGVFYTPHPDFAQYQFHFGRATSSSEPGSPRPVVEAFHGPHWYTQKRYQGPRDFSPPPGWRAYPGHYRSHNPWSTNFRVIQRKGSLVFIQPFGEEPLHPLGGGRFRLGADPRSPERLQFDLLLNERAQRAILSGGEYSRTFTP